MRAVSGFSLGLVLLLGGCGSKDDSASTGAAASTGNVDGSTSFSPPSDDDPGMTTNPSPPGDTGPGDGPTDTGSAEGSFVMTPDGGGANECDPTAQDCPRGEKCTAWANDGGTFWNANRCVEIGGTAVAGDECMVEGSGVSGVDDCALAHICLNSNEKNIGVCTAFCEGDDLQCATGDACAVYNDGVLPLCLPGCDPLLQDCPAGQSCIDTPNQTFICFSDASGAGGADGDPCPPEHGENSCDPGQWCGPNSAGCMDLNCCTPFCDLSSPECTAPDECVSFFGDPGAAPPGFENVGVCVLP